MFIKKMIIFHLIDLYRKYFNSEEFSVEALTIVNASEGNKLPAANGSGEPDQYPADNRREYCLTGLVEPGESVKIR